jgi:hypothetical protein
MCWSCGIKQAAALNTIATDAKVVPIFVFIVVVIYAFRAEVFAENFWGSQAPGLASLSAQVRGTMLLTVFVFVRAAICGSGGGKWRLRHPAAQGGNRGHHHRRRRARPGPRRRPLHDLPDYPRPGRLTGDKGASPPLARQGRVAAIAVGVTFPSLILLTSIPAAGDSRDAGIDADDARTEALLGAFGPSKSRTLDRGSRALFRPANNRHGPRPHRRGGPPAPQS